MTATLISNGRIYVEEGRFEEALLIEDGLIRAVGSTAALRAAAPAGVEEIDARGRLVLPGFNDSHCHLMSLGRNLEELSFVGVTSLEGMLERIRTYLAEHDVPAGTVLRGNGWNHDYFTDVQRMPTAADLDAASPDVGLVLSRTCGHVAVANSAAMRAAGITAQTAANPGGAIDRNADGTPNGIFRENALAQIYAAVSRPTRNDLARQLRAALRHAAECGVTSVHSMDVEGGNWREVLDIYSEVLSETPSVRVNHQVNFMTPALFEDFLSSGLHTGSTVGTPLNRVGPLKLFVDGSLGARTALLRAPYHDDPSTCGIATVTPEGLAELVGMAVSHGMQTTIHAIGDGAISRVIDAYEPYTSPNGENPMRLGIVHVQITDRALLERMASRGILAHVQPIFLHYDTTIAAQRVGETLARTSYAFRTMDELGIPVSYGTDSPVEDINPWDNLWCAVTRRRLTGDAPAFVPEECVSLPRAVDDYTAGGSFASFEENVKGRLLPGYAADLVIASENIFENGPESLRRCRADLTMTAGRVVYTRENGFAFA